MLTAFRDRYKALATYERGSGQAANIRAIAAAYDAALPLNKKKLIADNRAGPGGPKPPDARGGDGEAGGNDRVGSNPLSSHQVRSDHHAGADLALHASSPPRDS